MLGLSPSADRTGSRDAPNAFAAYKPVLETICSRMLRLPLSSQPGLILRYQSRGERDPKTGDIRVLTKIAVKIEKGVIHISVRVEVKMQRG
jgi:hypothetical protein